jgi:glucosamine-phosphate N-acetyltransferase
MAAEQDLFDPALIDQVSPAARDRTAEDGLVTRPLRSDDFRKGYTELLGQLTKIGGVDDAGFRRRFQDMRDAGDVYYTVVIEDAKKGKIVGCATLFVEKKVIRGLGLVGHVEDVVVDKQYRGFRLGIRVIQQLRHIADELKCYKVILDCSEDNVPFYERCGFKLKEVQMVVYSPTANL